jgi:hypothetical protein
MVHHPPAVFGSPNLRWFMESTQADSHETVAAHVKSRRRLALLALVAALTTHDQDDYARRCGEPHEQQGDPSHVSTTSMSTAESGTLRAPCKGSATPR